MTALLLQIDFKSGKPPYLQLVDQVRYAVASGVIRPGEPLPAIRSLAEELHLNRNTIAKAYTELENMGVIETFSGKGCFIKDSGSQLTKQARHQLVASALDDALVTAHQLQVDRETFLALARERADFFAKQHQTDTQHES